MEFSGELGCHIVDWKEFGVADFKFGPTAWTGYYSVVEKALKALLTESVAALEVSGEFEVI